MPLKRMVIEATLISPGAPFTGAPHEYKCGYNRPQTERLEVGNPPGSEVIDVNWRWAVGQRPPIYISAPWVDVVDPTHVSLTCDCVDDGVLERARIQIVCLVQV